MHPCCAPLPHRYHRGMPRAASGATRLLTVTIAVLAVVMTTVAGPVPVAYASPCPPASAGGESIAWITVGDERVPIKPVTLSRTGALDPPPSNRVAGVSVRHAPLASPTGTSVVTWHMRYGQGCPGRLNDLVDLPIGSTFSVETKDGSTTRYAITGREVVPRGSHRAEWFDQRGPRRLSLFTCAGLMNGRFTKTLALFAEPVRLDPFPSETPTPSGTVQ